MKKEESLETNSHWYWHLEEAWNTELDYPKRFIPGNDCSITNYRKQNFIFTFYKTKTKWNALVGLESFSLKVNASLSFLYSSWVFQGASVPYFKLRPVPSHAVKSAVCFCFIESPVTSQEWVAFRCWSRKCSTGKASEFVEMSIQLLELIDVCSSQRKLESTVPGKGFPRRHEWLLHHCDRVDQSV